MSTKALRRASDLLPSVFNDFLKPWNEWLDTNGNAWGNVLTTPAVNITENKNDFKVSLAVPGMKKDDFKIDVDGNMLTISAETESKKEEDEEKYTRKEYNYSSFNRSFTLPEGVNKENIEAKYEDGVLNLFLPKNEEAKKLAPKQIVVK